MRQRFDLPQKIELYRDTSQLVRDPKGDFWKQYWSEHPNASGLIGISNVALSDDGNEAIVYAEQTRGGLDGWRALRHAANGRGLEGRVCRGPLGVLSATG